MKRILLLAVLCLSYLNIYAQYLVFADKNIQGARYEESMIEGTLGEQRYYGSLKDLTVLYNEENKVHVISARFGDYWELTASAIYDHSDNGFSYYLGQCETKVYAIHDNDSLTLETNIQNVTIATKTKLRRFTACQGIAKDLAYTKYLNRERFSGEDLAIHVFVGSNVLTFVPVVDNSAGNVVEYVEDCPFPLAMGDPGLLISDISGELRFNFEDKLKTSMESVIEGYSSNGILVGITDSLTIDASGVTSHNFSFASFISEYPELQDKIMDTLSSIQFGPVELKRYGAEEGVAVPCQDVFILSFIKTTKPAGFKKGDANEFSRWINERLVYPEYAKKNRIQGRVVLGFTVSKDGSVTNVKILKGVHPLLDNEALRVVNLSPKWTPAEVLGQKVSITYTFPVIFHLR